MWASRSEWSDVQMMAKTLTEMLCKDGEPIATTTAYVVELVSEFCTGTIADAA